MFEKTLVKGAKDVLALLGRSGILRKGYLAGGTALALQLGHRISVDFDFFTEREFIPRTVSEQLARIARFKEVQAEKGTVIGDLKGIRFSLFLYRYPLVFPTSDCFSLRIADIRDIGAMKIDAVSTRGLKRDFIDLYFICHAGYGLTDLLLFYQKKYEKLASNLFHIEKSLVYFEDAEPDPMPEMLKPVKWAEVKRFFEREVKVLAKKTLGLS